MPKCAQRARSAAHNGALIQEFEAWMRSMGITWDADIILTDGLTTGGGLSLGVQAAQDIPEGKVLCSIPKDACISMRTSSIADILEAEQLGGGLALVIAVCHEMALGSQSKWHGYFQALPPREYVPMFWTADEVELLRGSELEGQPVAVATDVSDDYQSHVAPMLERHASRLRPALMTVQHFQAAASLVGSRSFGVDDHHGDAMVPLADVFNHKVSVVDLSDRYAVHGKASSSDSDSASASADGSIDSAEGEGGGEEEEAEGEGEEGRPDSVDAAHKAAEKLQDGGIMRLGALPSVLGIGSANGLHLALEIAIVDQGAALQIVAAAPVQRGQEIHNTYGELGNAELVSKYGFALPENPFTAVKLSKDVVVAACEALYISSGDGAATDAAAGAGSQKKRRRRGSGQQGSSNVAAGLLKILVDESDLLDDEEEPFEVLANGHVGPALFATLRVLCSGADGGSAVSSLDGALVLPGVEGQGGIDPGSIGAVQVWPSPAGSPWGAAGAAHADGSAGYASELGLSSMLTAPVCRALLSAVVARLACYPCDSTVMALQLEQSSKIGDVARQAALTLRLTEQRVLLGVQAAAEQRLQHLTGVLGSQRRLG